MESKRISECYTKSSPVGRLTDSDGSAQSFWRMIAPRQFKDPMEDISPDALEPVMSRVLLRIRGDLHYQSRPSQDWVNS